MDFVSGVLGRLRGATTAAAPAVSSSSTVSATAATLPSMHPATGSALSSSLSSLKFGNSGHFEDDHDHHPDADLVELLASIDTPASATNSSSSADVTAPSNAHATTAPRLNAASIPLSPPRSIGLVAAPPVVDTDGAFDDDNTDWLALFNEGEDKDDVQSRQTMSLKSDSEPIVPSPSKKRRQEVMDSAPMKSPSAHSSQALPLPSQQYQPQMQIQHNQPQPQQPTKIHSSQRQHVSNPQLQNSPLQSPLKKNVVPLQSQATSMNQASLNMNQQIQSLINNNDIPNNNSHNQQQKPSEYNPKSATTALENKPIPQRLPLRQLDRSNSGNQPQEMFLRMQQQQQNQAIKGDTAKGTISVNTTARDEVQLAQSIHDTQQTENRHDDLPHQYRSNLQQQQPQNTHQQQQQQQQQQLPNGQQSKLHFQGLQNQQQGQRRLPGPIGKLPPLHMIERDRKFLDSTDHAVFNDTAMNVAKGTGNSGKARDHHQSDVGERNTEKGKPALGLGSVHDDASKHGHYSSSQSAHEETSNAPRNSVPGPTQTGVPGSQFGRSREEDFKHGSWHDMLVDLRLPEYHRENWRQVLRNVPSPFLTNNIRKIALQGPGKNGKVPFLCVMVKEIHPRDGGSQRVSLADPSGEIIATIRSHVLDELKVELTAGATLVLRETSVWNPTPRSRYLNIAAENIYRFYPAVVTDDTSQANNNGADNSTTINAAEEINSSKKINNNEGDDLGLGLDSDLDVRLTPTDSPGSRNSFSPLKQQQQEQNQQHPDHQNIKIDPQAKHQTVQIDSHAVQMQDMSVLLDDLGEGFFDEE